VDSLYPAKFKAAIRYIDSWLDINFKNSNFPGMQVAIRHRDETVYSKAFGYSDIVKRDKLTTGHAFRIASISKSITATAIMQLIEAGKLDLDEKVSQYLDWFQSCNDDRIANITIRQLLSNTSGMIRDGIDSDYWLRLREFPDKQELVDYISTAELIYDADVRYKYSNYGYGYLGFVIEAASGLPYREYVTKNIIKKLDLKCTWPDLVGGSLSVLANGYSQKIFDYGRKKSKAVDTRALSPAAGFCSNAQDVCSFFVAHCYGNNELISDHSKRQMQNSYSETHFGHYGLGLDVIEKQGRTLYGHGGSGSFGYRTNAQFDPHKQLVVSIFINSDAVNANNICNSLINIIDVFQGINNQKQTDNDMTTFEGRFFSSDHKPVDILAIGSRLFAVRPLDWSEFNKADELVVKSSSILKIFQADGFRAPGEDVVYTFDSKHKVTSVRFAGRTMLP
jgi:D-alanyl-D-alanine carboxypeptidase